MKIRFSYKDSPTLLSFSESDAFIRTIMGPFSSGKSAACTMEILLRGLKQKPGIDGIKRTRWVIVRNCYDDKTEILTENRGWQFFKNLSFDDKVATLKENKYTVYEKPTYYYSDDYNGEMIGVKNENMDLLVTPDHNLWVSRINGKTKERSKWHLQRAGDIFGKTNFEFKTSADWRGGKANNTNDYFEFLGFWFAEGHAAIYRHGGYKRYCLIVSQKKYVDYVEDLLKRNNFKYSMLDKGDKNYNFRISIDDRVRKIIEKLKEYGKAKTKFIPLWIKNAPKSYLRSFIHGFVVGDGHYSGNKHDTTRAWTTSKQLADDLQEIAFKAGYAVIVNKTKKIYSLTFLTLTRATPQPKKNHWYKKRYNGKIYCVEVSSHIVYVRRNGKPIWCSQTNLQLKDTTIKTFQDWLPPEKYGTWLSTDKDYIINKIEGVIVEVMFRALDKPEDVAKLLSMEVTGAWINEVREIPKPIFEGLQGRVGRYPAVKDGGCSWAGIIMDTNPPDTDHWMYKMFEEPGKSSDPIEYICPACETKFDIGASDICPECGWKYKEIFKQPSGISTQAENLPNLRLNYYQNLMKDKNPEYIKVYVHGEYGYVQDGKPVHPDFKDSLHVAKEDLKPIFNLPLIIGMDFGLEVACIICQLTPRGRFIVLEEIVSEDMGIRRMVRDYLKPTLISKYRGFKVVGIGDPAGNIRVQTDERTCLQEVTAAGIPIRPAPTNSPVARIEALNSFLTKLVDGKPAFLMSPSCKVLRKGLNGKYRFKRVRVSGDEKYKDKPEKNIWSHICEATQYAAMDADLDIAKAIKYVRGKYSEPGQTPSPQGYL